MWSLQGYWILVGVHFTVGFLTGIAIYLKAKKAGKEFLGFLTWLTCSFSSLISPLLLFVIVPLSLAAIKENSGEAVIASSEKVNEQDESVK